MRSYTELSSIDSYEERYKYLKIGSTVGAPTFGFDRYINQKFYSSAEWKNVRNRIIARDNGCDMGVPGHEIHGRIIIHHMNPIEVKNLFEKDLSVIDPEMLICVSEQTHRAIHYGDESMIDKPPITRRPGDTCLWKARKEEMPNA